jgi:dihydropyrimidinase
VSSRTVRRGGEVVTASESFRADVLLAGDRVAHIGTVDSLAADRVIDAADCFAIPEGVDPHTHLESPSDDFTTRTCDGFDSAARAPALDSSSGSTAGTRASD